jgi:hypothetical protein
MAMIRFTKNRIVFYISLPTKEEEGHYVSTNHLRGIVGVSRRHYTSVRCRLYRAPMWSISKSLDAVPISWRMEELL